MNPQLKEEWIKALRSNEYEQGIGRLRSLDDKFCCLGVLCDLYSKKNKGRWERIGYDLYFIDDKGNKAQGLLPESIVYEQDLHEHKDILMSMNDTEGNSFWVISFFIEKNL